VDYRVTLSGVSDIGRVRKRNEDSMSLAPTLGIAVIADGMGGHPGGDVASRIAAATVAASLERHFTSAGGAVSSDPHRSAAHLDRAMVESVLSAHAAVRAEAEDRAELSGMGTTLTALAIEAGTGVFAVGHVGDSRAYRLRGGRLSALTRDDTWVQTQVDAARLTAEQARHHPFGHILTQCLGLEEEPYPHVLTGDVTAGDAYLLCTDGLVGMVEDADIAATLLQGLADGDGAGRTDAAARALVEKANELGGYDNVTVVIALVE
jgi:serine/threonine protein phosphatase PrpC